MAGILGDFLGLGGTQAPTPGLLDAAGYMDPAQYDRMRQNQSMMGLWAGLLAGGGPSLSPRNFGSALGAGLTGAQQFGAQFDEASQHRAAAQKNLADIVAKKQGFQIAQDWINKGGTSSGTPADGAAAPGSGSSTPNFGGDYKGSGDPASLVKHFESGGNYNIGYGGTDLSNAPRDQYGFPQWAGKDNSHAAGAYQFQPGTWAKYAAPLGITDFSQESQDKVFAAAFAAEGWKPWAPYNPRLAAEVARRTSSGAGERTTAAGAPVPDFTEGRAAAFDGPAPAPAVLTAPGANPNAGPVARLPGVNVSAPPNPTASPVSVRQLAGDAVPAEAGPSFGYGSAGGAISPAALAAAAGGAPPVPAALAAPAQPVPAPAPAGAIPPPAAAAAPAPAGTRPPAGPGEVTVTLPKPPALGEMLPVPAAQPQPLPAAPEIPGVPARPQIPGATAGAAVSPAVAARARQAQGVVLGLSMMGVHVPDFLQKEAGIEVAGRTAAAEAEAKQPIELQNKAFEASLTAAQKRWDALDDQQKQTLAFQRGLTKDQMNAMYANIHEQYKSILGLTTARVMEEQKTAGGAENTQTTMVIGNREVPMTVAQANRISRGESPEQVLGPGVLQLGKAANTGQIPEGYQMVPGADGGGPRMEPLPGSPQARALDQRQTSQQQNASVVTQDLRRAQDLVTGGFVTGLYGRGAQIFPGTDRTRFDALVGGIGANFSIDRLQQMRDASPTGGALGQVTEGEHKLLRDSYGSLSPEQGEKQLSENIGRVHQRYMDIVNGTPEQLGKMLREGRITKDRYDTLIAQRDLPAGGGAAATPGGAIRTPYGTIRPVQ